MPSDSSFEQLMASMGVRPLPGAAPSVQKGGARGSAAKPPVPTPPAVPPAPPPEPEARRLERELTRAVAEIEAVRTELSQAKKERESALSETVDHQRVAVQERAAADALRFEVEALRTERDRLLTERSRLDRKVAELNQRRAPDPPTPLREVLEKRGLRGDAELHAVLEGFARGKTAELLSLLSVSDVDAAAKLFDRRIVLAGPHVAATPSGCVAVRVDEERCELQGAGDLRAAWAGVLGAARRAGLKQVTIVGGSPAYRDELRDLCAHGDSLRVRLVDGATRRPKHRAEADRRASDLVVIWGATELDHSVSAGYEDDALRIPNRGLVGMLRALAEQIEGPKRQE